MEVSSLTSWFWSCFRRVDQVPMNLMVGLSIGIGTVLEKVHWKIFPARRGFRRRQRISELLAMKVEWPEGGTSTRWVAGKENKAKP